MTPQEALKIIDKAHDYPCPYGIGGAAWMYIRSCIEKQIPKKLLYIGIEQCCPVCKESICLIGDDGCYGNFCENCGQALDWSDTE